MKAKPKKQKARDATGVIEWGNLTPAERASFLEAYNKKPALEARCSHSFVKAESERTALASHIEVNASARVMAADLLSPESAMQEAQGDLLEKINATAKVSKRFIQATIWLWIVDNDAASFEWLAEHIRERKLQGVHRVKQPSQEIEITLGGTFPALILKQFLKLAGVKSTFILTSAFSTPKSLPTKAYLKKKVREEWQRSGHKSDNIDKDFSAYCTAIGLGQLPPSSRNPAWDKAG